MEIKLCIILTLLQVGKVRGDCGTVYKDVHSFGPECRYRCNCKNNKQCNNVTGECPDGCLPGWMGPACQYRNLANQIKSSTQNPTTATVSEWASVATDGNISTCSRTGSAVGGRYWQAELEELTYIVGFVIKIKPGDAGRFQGFSINVGNTTNVAELCYRHGVNADGNSTMDINCEKPIVGSYFRIQLAEIETQSLVLCEIEIYGGRLVSFNKPTHIESKLDYTGTWDSFYAADGRHPKLGEDQDNKTIRTCAATGVSDPAIDKWWSLYLNNTYSIIAISFYGRYVRVEQYQRLVVKTGLNDSSLQLFFEDTSPSWNVSYYLPKSSTLTWPVDGAIARVERYGNILVVCELEVFADCKYGSCGWECKETCMCSGQTTGTHKIQGTCPHGCSVRWRGLDNKCDKECPENKWGLNCSNTCGNCVETCYAATGSCSGSCKPGFIPPDCIQECSDGKYGTNCSFTCGFCKNGAYCNKTTGDCISGCKPGYKVQKCSDTCESGKYGDGCNNVCGNCFNGSVCTPINGSCPGGCAAGYFETECKTPCPSGWYGPNCSTKCGYCDSAADCNKTTGNCSNGCLSGWLGSLCIDPCEDGLYGINCTSSCGNCSNNEPCDKTSGDCRACAPGYQMKTCTKKSTVQPPDNKSTIIGAVVGTVVALVVALVAVLIFIKRGRIRRKFTSDKKESTFEDLEITDDRHENNVRILSEQSTPIPEPNVDKVYENTIKVQEGQDKDDNSIVISNLRLMCYSAKRDPNSLFSEFQSLPYGLNGDASEASIAAYKPKNRYKEIYPYNANRVHLPEIPDSPSSTYINASYINGYDQKKKYIAAQGAIKTTIDDIWRMIWSENINIIVMLTNCVEVGKMKCEQYWPDEDSSVYGTICTELITVEHYSDFVVRTFKCTNQSSDVSRTVVQFHYTAWPDKDVPDTVLSIVQFWRKVREHNPENKTSRKSPWLVHCSAGVGRTGTYIAMDVLYDQGKAEGKVNFKETVYSLREQRLNMVQTKKQYVLLHCIVAEILDPIGTVCTSEEFSDVYKQLISNSVKNKQKLFLEYQQVGKATDEFYQEQDEGDTYCNVASNMAGASTDYKRPENAAKSRNLQIHIEDRDRPRLCTAVNGCNDFINAVYIPTYRYRDRLILTQCPLENTVVDFIRMIWDCSITDVVYLEEKLPRDKEAYWPINRERKTVGPFIAELVSEQATECCTHRTLRFTLTTNKQQKEVRQYHFHHWPQQKDIPVDTASMLSLISAVDEQFRKEGDSRLVIQCLDGAKKSGLFCVLYSVIQRLKMDRQVAVAETVLLARTKRRQIIDNFEQYKYCHDVIDEHLQSSNLYANFA